MFGFLGKSLKKLFGTQNEREINRLWPIVHKINVYEEEIHGLTDDEIKKRILSYREKLKSAFKEKEEETNNIRELILSSTSEQERNKYKKSLITLKNSLVDRYLPEVFGLVREAAKRTIGLRHFDVQLIGGMVLHYGKIAEMTTGEGKTLVATLPASLNALAGEKVHVITVNDYLAKRDYEWMGPVYKFLGLTVGVILHDMRPDQRKKAYSCDIVYGTNNEFGFDYLRDNMVGNKEEIVQSPLRFAIVDEVDSILIDEARTPLIISGPVDESNEAYMEMRPVVQEIVRAQRKQVEDYLNEIKKCFNENKEEEAGNLLYLIHKADPKNRDFLDLIMKDRNAKNLLDRTQGNLDSKIMEKERDEFLEKLFYVYDERSRDVAFSAKGIDLMRSRFNVEFMLEDIEAKLAVLSNEDISLEEKLGRETELTTSYTEQQRKVESIKQLLKAYILFQKDVDYVIKDNKVVIVDSFTGRMMPGRRFSDGIHEAIEAKEKVEVQKESQTLATITLQNYFRMYEKLSGMTGTAKTEESEFDGIYLMPVVQIPTNKPLNRENMPDRIYKTEKEKFDAIIEEIADWHEKGRPVLVGTISIEKSERLSRLLNTKGVRHNVLNAKYHEREAHIIAQAGSFGGVTIATNMAGRGTDILLGGNAEHLAMLEVEKLGISDLNEKENVLTRYIKEYKTKNIEEQKKVVALGGLHVIGTERHEARRIDNQLRGRAGRQGDPGASRFYLSLEDDLMRIFGSDRIKAIMDRLGMEEGEVIENPLVTRAISTAQKRVESQNFEVRKHLLKYDNIMNQQREVIYKRRRMILDIEDPKEEFFESVRAALSISLETWEDNPEPEVFAKSLMYKYAMKIDPASFENKHSEDVLETVMEKVKENRSAREKYIGRDRLQYLERMVMLSVIDSNWKEYLREIDDLREGIYWRAYAQKDPFVEFQHESFSMFTDLMEKIDSETAENIMKISFMEEQARKVVFRPEKEVLEHKEYSALGRPAAGQDVFYESEEGERVRDDFPLEEAAKGETFKREEPKVGRNDPCPCGSGKKYKKCCGK